MKEHFSPVNIAIAVIVVVVTIFFLLINKRNNAKKKSGRENNTSTSNKPQKQIKIKQSSANNSSTKSTPTSETTISSNDNTLRNVFDIKQSHPLGKGMDAQSISQKTKSKVNENEDKPFGSSYYYAHNSSNARGGYQDGLRAEDYTMNGPKLLSKGGISTTDVDPKNRIEMNENGVTTANVSTSQDQGTKLKTSNITAGNDTTPSTNKTTTTKTTSFIKGNSISINRYSFWDEDSTEGIAKIYIDTLPSSSNAKNNIKWQDAGITKADVTSKLIGERGLFVQIKQGQGGSSDVDDDQYYHLHISHLYGEVDEVKTIVKAKRLIIKLTKKRKKSSSMFNLLGKGSGTEEMKAWPQLTSEATSKHDVGHINEDLFKQG